MADLKAGDIVDVLVVHQHEGTKKIPACVIDVRETSFAVQALRRATFDNDGNDRMWLENAAVNRTWSR